LETLTSKSVFDESTSVAKVDAQEKSEQAMVPSASLAEEKIASTDSPTKGLVIVPALVLLGAVARYVQPIFQQQQEVNQADLAGADDVYSQIV